MWPSLIIVAHIIVIIGVCVAVIMMRLPVGTALAWIVMIFFLPFAGAVIYLVLGEKRLGRKRSRRAASLWGRYNRWLRELPRQVPDDQSGLSPKSAAISRLFFAMHLMLIFLIGLRYVAQIDGVNTAVAAIQAELDQARYYLDNTLMVAPQDGRIVNLQVRPGMVSGQYRIGAIASFICDEGRYLLTNFFFFKLVRIVLGLSSLQVHLLLQ